MQTPVGAAHTGRSHLAPAGCRVLLLSLSLSLALPAASAALSSTCGHETSLFLLVVGEHELGDVGPLDVRVLELNGSGGRAARALLQRALHPQEDLGLVHGLHGAARREALHANHGEGLKRIVSHKRKSGGKTM